MALNAVNHSSFNERRFFQHCNQFVLTYPKYTFTMSKQHIDSLCIFLKLLYEETKDEPKLFPLQILAKEYKLPYASSVSTVLIEKGIVIRTNAKDHKSMYKWSTTTEPNKKMAEAVISNCKIKALGYMQHSLNREATPSTVKPLDYAKRDLELVKKITHTQSPLGIIQKHVNEFKVMLISMGFTEEKALEIIKSQIK